MVRGDKFAGGFPQFLVDWWQNLCGRASEPKSKKHYNFHCSRLSLWFTTRYNLDAANERLPARPILAAAVLATLGPTLSSPLT
jgi:hypothetical protein